jgi:tetratricopeptide (TPR) repeat protein
LSDDGWKAARFEEVKLARGVEDARWHQVRIHFGIGAFGINAYGADKGKRVIEEHDEVGPSAGRHEELYFVHRGHARFTVGGEDHDAPEGTFVHVPDPETKRGAIAEEDGTVVLVMGAKRGAPFEVSIWEQAAPAWDAWAAKDFETAVRELTAINQRYPDNANMLYNLACAEALTGRADEALRHLDRAIELREQFRELAQNDEDFASIRDDPRFPR